MMFENIVLKRIFGPRRGEMTKQSTLQLASAMSNVQCTTRMTASVILFSINGFLYKFKKRQSFTCAG
jgi:hypothetical protein